MLIGTMAPHLLRKLLRGNKLLKIDFADFLGTQLNSVVDATAMTNFHMDVWIADDFEAGQIFNPKWSNHAGGDGETNAFELTKAIGDTDAKKWLSIDVPITDFTGDATRANLEQFLIAVAGKSVSPMLTTSTSTKVVVVPQHQQMRRQHRPPELRKT
jgi:hypothetical protein